MYHSDSQRASTPTPAERARHTQPHATTHRASPAYTPPPAVREVPSLPRCARGHLPAPRSREARQAPLHSPAAEPLRNAPLRLRGFLRLPLRLPYSRSSRSAKEGQKHPRPGTQNENFGNTAAEAVAAGTP